MLNMSASIFTGMHICIWIHNCQVEPIVDLYTALTYKLRALPPVPLLMRRISLSLSLSLSLPPSLPLPSPLSLPLFTHLPLFLFSTRTLRPKVRVQDSHKEGVISLGHPARTGLLYASRYACMHPESMYKNNRVYARQGTNGFVHNMHVYMKKT